MPFKLVARAVLLWLLCLPCTAGFAADTVDVQAALDVPVTALTADDDLQSVQDRLDVLKQQVSVATEYEQLVTLRDHAEQLIKDADQVALAKRPELLQVQAQLDVIGPAPVVGAAPETPAVAQQRAMLSDRKALAVSELQQLQTIKESASRLTVQIGEVRRNELESQITLRSQSLLNPQFWSSLFYLAPDDQQRLRAFNEQVVSAVVAVWQPERRANSVMLLLLALALCTVIRQLLERFLGRYCMRRLPVGRLRRSTLALLMTLTTLVTVGGSFALVYRVFIPQDNLSPALQNFAEEFVTLTFTCVFLAGLSRALLSVHHPSWRLPDIADPVALAIRPFAPLLAAVLMVCATSLRVSYVIGMSVQVNILGRGLLALMVILIVGAALWRLHQARKQMIAAGEPIEDRTLLSGLLLLGVAAVLLVASFALLTGYISFASFLVYQLIWFYMVLSCVYLLTQWLLDVCESLFSPRHASGKALKQVLGLGDERLEQVEIVLKGAIRAFLLLLMVVALFVGGFGTSLTELFNSTLVVLGGEGLRTLNIVPRHLLNGALIFLIGWYLIRTLRRWLDAELLPKTDMDPGMWASLSTLFSNIGYAVLIVLTFYALGVKWSNLAWIVSALSVGIGFGLQEIVKNFVSGLILLTERPVKVGDLVSFGEIEGDIKRINVRATEIQLADRSMVIVPNSQLISQNLRNVTKGGVAQGVAMLELTFTPDIDPEQIKTLLYESFSEHEAILEKPAPTVRFIKVTVDGVLVRVTGFVSSPRVVLGTKSELLIDILKRLHGAGIALAGTPAVLK
ncbi:DUF3772 domain-containing protein [Pseudomonas fontis]|uniref:DUF3772 domain-containing protein n=1 Tax=Pseudomonas fontis TaxID=2942633 RepID=A0ABT5NPF8_9PSED|nr:DUF3772 domain-containing protein [Pseudomonas fontis]MDD0973763.1 DUF3772 domain-containing protein [Pseudomonas fontis]MDD0990065.1 DUF3772 domain-containing protein [Pseudomonas fontis]